MRMKKAPGWIVAGSFGRSLMRSECCLTKDAYFRRRTGRLPVREVILVLRVVV